MPGRTGHRRVFLNEAEPSFMRRLAERGLVPDVLDWANDHAVIAMGEPLNLWLAGSTDLARREMREAILDLIYAMHAAGVCHRDLHSRNIVIIDGHPLVIDLAMAAEVDPAWPCYDLTGPSPQVPLPSEHACQGGLIGTHGVWWDAPKDDRWLDDPHVAPLGIVFGPLEGGLGSVGRSLHGMP